MENEILEYIDDVRTEYPEVVADDEPIIIQESDDIREEDILQVSEKPILAVSEDKIENINEIKMVGVLDSESKSNVIILSSDDSNNRSSGEVFDLDNFDSLVLWSNSNPTSLFNAQYVNLNDSISNYDYIGVYYIPQTGLSNGCTVLIPVSDFINLTTSNQNRFTLGSLLNVLYVREIKYSSDTSIYFNNSYYNLLHTREHLCYY